MGETGNSSSAPHGVRPESAPTLLHEIAPELERVLNLRCPSSEGQPPYDEAAISRDTVHVQVRDGVRLSTDLYFPPVLPAPVVITRTPYGRRADKLVRSLLDFARRGYVAISQDCRGTGDSEPTQWHFSVYEYEDGADVLDWIVDQSWHNGFTCAFGGSYSAMTQWTMAAHARMSAIAPEVAGLNVTRSTVRRHMFVNAYSLVTGRGARKWSIPIGEIERVIEHETLSTGYFNEQLNTGIPDALLERFEELQGLSAADAKRRLWDRCCSCSAAERIGIFKAVLRVKEFSYLEYSLIQAFFDSLIPFGINSIPSTSESEICARLRAPALVITGWYDWNLGDTLASWAALRRSGDPRVARRSRLIITPAAHNTPGYKEGADGHPELLHDHRSNSELLLAWYRAVRDGATDSWPTVTYYLMGANEWRVAADWPDPATGQIALYLDEAGTLSFNVPATPAPADRFSYNPNDPTPTVGGSILSYLYEPGSVDVSGVQARSDVLTYTTRFLERDLDVVGPIGLVLYASSSAVDTDFVGRLSDVFPDGRAVQLQNGALRARYRDVTGEPDLLQPGKIYRLEIDLWAIANRFQAGHRIRLDVSSADFPRFDRNSNLGGQAGAPAIADQAIFHGSDYPSRLLLNVLS
jgi:uncharacterized protein